MTDRERQDTGGNRERQGAGGGNRDQHPVDPSPSVAPKAVDSVLAVDTVDTLESVESEPEFDAEPGALQAIGRGLRRRCPRCGQAPIFERFITVRDRCASCALRFEERAGDTWGFWVLLDRLFIVIPFAILLFGFATASLRLRVALIVALLIPLVLTMPHRQGVIVALDYLIRRGRVEE